MIARRPLPVWTIVGLAVGVIGNLLAAAPFVLSLYHIAPGTSVRLLGESLVSGIATLGTVAAASTLSVVAWRKEGARIMAIIMVGLALASFPFSGWALRHVAASRGIFLKS